MRVIVSSASFAKAAPVPVVVNEEKAVVQSDGEAPDTAALCSVHVVEGKVVADGAVAEKGNSLPAQGKAAVLFSVPAQGAPR